MKTKLFALLLLTASLVSCTGFVETSYKSLATFRAAYKVEEPARKAFCEGKVPQPPACITALNAAKVGYATFLEADELLAIYVETKAAAIKDRINALLPTVISAAFDLTKVVQELQ